MDIEYAHDEFSGMPGCTSAAAMESIRDPIGASVPTQGATRCAHTRYFRTQAMSFTGLQLSGHQRCMHVAPYHPSLVRPLRVLWLFSGTCKCSVCAQNYGEADRCRI